jgi:NAD(P)-dependent dehydrogenase (short-subunit alcohol dehydrogenase family)
MGTKYILISGAARGIGAVTTVHLAATGFVVFAGVRTVADGEAIRRHHPDRIRPVVMDVADMMSIEAAIADVQAQLGPDRGLDGLINNAGIYHGGPLQYLSVAEIRQMVDVNLVGAMMLTRAALPLLRLARGRVLMHGSAMGLMTAPTIAIYGATKAGMAALSEGLRLELGLVGVSVVLIEPGSVKTDLTAAGSEKLSALLKRMPKADLAVFEPVLRRVVELSDPTQSGIEAIEVAKIMALALNTAHPRSRYRVGKDSKAAAIIRLFPDRIVDRIQKAIFKVGR